jgi:hypothetical protein
MKNKKTTIKLTESQMISLIEKIVGEVKKEKRTEIMESLKREKLMNESKNKRK